MADDVSPTLEPGNTGNPLPTDSEPEHRRRKRKVKRSSRIARKAGYIIALAIAWMVLLAIWYYLVNRPGPQPPA